MQMLQTYENDPLGLARASKTTHGALKALAWQKNRSIAELGIQLEGTAGGTVVRKENEPIALMPPGRFDRKALLSQIIARAQQLGALAMRSFDAQFTYKLLYAPPYEIRHDLQHDLRWIETAGANHSSLYLKNPTVDMYEPEQLACEFRIFLDSPRAHLFLTYGQQYEFRSTPLLEGKQPFVYADTFDELSQKVICLYNEASRASWDRLDMLDEQIPSPLPIRAPRG